MKVAVIGIIAVLLLGLVGFFMFGGGNPQRDSLSPPSPAGSGKTPQGTQRGAPMTKLPFGCADLITDAEFFSLVGLQVSKYDVVQLDNTGRAGPSYECYWDYKGATVPSDGRTFRPIIFTVSTNYISNGETSWDVLHSLVGRTNDAGDAYVDVPNIGAGGIQLITKDGKPTFYFVFLDTRKKYTVTTSPLQKPVNYLELSRILNAHLQKY